jgi:hypothetical protein
MLQIREWEDGQLPELQTISGRNLYFRIAASYLNDPDMPQHLKLLQGGVTERATRQRLREFEEQGLIEILCNESDQRTKRAKPTEKFLMHLNQHMDLFKHMCGQQFWMLDKK